MTAMKTSPDVAPKKMTFAEYVKFGAKRTAGTPRPPKKRTFAQHVKAGKRQG